jgi:hypothetical protein
MADIYSNLTQKRLQQLYTYDPETGLLISCKYNRTVGYNHNGYLAVDIDNKHVKVHRIVWMMSHGKWPNPMIDHINGNRKDNRICNLREVTNKQNQENKRASITKNGLPKSGYKGVHWNRFTKKWIASISHDKKKIYIGSFTDPQKAFFAYKQLAQKLHTHNEIAKA